MSRRIIVPLDGSPFAEAALAVAAGMAAAGDRLDLVTAVEGSPPFSVPDYQKLAAEWAERYLAGVVERLPEREWTAQTHVLLGVPTRQLRHFIDEAEADLVVMATHGRGPFSRAWLGSMTDTLVRTCTTPILLVHPQEKGEPSFEPAAPPDRILLPLDGSELSESALDGIRDLIPKGSTLVLLRVVQYPFHFASPYLPDTVHGNQEVFKQAAAGARDYLTEVAWRLGSADYNVQTQVTVSEHPAQAITDFAEANGCDWIAMATHGRGGVVRLALGSVADKVIRTAKIPVLTFLPEDHGNEELLGKAGFVSL